MSLPSKPQRIPRLCYVTDRRSLLTADPAEALNLLLAKISAAGADGVDWIHIREKDLSARACSSLARDVLGRAANSTANPGGRPRILVHDRLDVALATEADGVHLGERSLSPREARRLVKSLRRENDFLIGVSCHSLETAQAAEESRADYIFFGPVFATPSKAAYGAPQGLERLGEVCGAVALPVLAIGGITLDNAAACLSAGAAGIAAIRLFQEAKDMAQIVRALRKLSA